MRLWKFFDPFPNVTEELQCRVHIAECSVHGIMAKSKDCTHVAKGVAREFWENERCEHGGIDPGVLAEIQSFRPEHINIEPEVLTNEEGIGPDQCSDLLRVFHKLRLSSDVLRSNAREDLDVGGNIIIGGVELLVLLADFPILYANTSQLDDLVDPREKPRCFGIEDDEWNGGIGRRPKA